MFEWLQNLGSSSSLEKLQRHFLEMLDDGRHVFDAAAGMLVSGGDPETIREDLYQTDQRINRTEQAVRREIMVHGVAHGMSSLGALLILMSTSKDAERIGDYSKNLFELACARPDLSNDEAQARMVAEKDQVSKLLVRARGIFEKQDEAAAADFLREANEFQKSCDAHVTQLLEVKGENKAALVLVSRYFKRVASHAANIVTTIVMPVDKIDYMPGKPSSEQ